jgi:hypothetical protein
VKDPDGALIFYVDLVLKPVSGGNMISFQNMNYPGSFSQNVQPGTYWLNATKSGYQTFKQQITIPNVAEYQMDIVLQPFVAICNTEWPAIALTGHAVKCKRQVDLSWSQNNCLDKVTGWRVYRNETIFQQPQQAIQTAAVVFSGIQTTIIMSRRCILILAQIRAICCRFQQAMLSARTSALANNSASSSQ